MAFHSTSYSSPLGIADRARCLRLPFSSAVALWEGGPPMNALLCRVGADQSLNGGSWNGLVDSKTGKFVYVAIPEGRQVHAGLEKPYGALAPLIRIMAEICHTISIRDTCTLIQISII